MVSGSLAGTAGAVSVVGLVGLVVSFLLKKFPKIELRFVAFGAGSRGVVPVVGSVGDVTAGSVEVAAAVAGATSLFVVAPVAGELSPFVTGATGVVVDSALSTGSTGSTGALTTRAATLN